MLVLLLLLSMVHTTRLIYANLPFRFISFFFFIISPVSRPISPFTSHYHCQPFAPILKLGE